MTRDEALSILRQSRPELVRRGVRRAALFGSIARGDGGPQSDVDVMLDIDPGAEVGLFAFAGLIEFIESQFPVPVDVVDRAGLRPRIRTAAEQDAVYAF